MCTSDGGGKAYKYEDVCNGYVLSSYNDMVGCK